MPSPPNQDTMQDNEPEAPTATVTFHPYGDTRLLLYNSSGAEIVFVVDSKDMMLVCTVWSRMLAPDGHFIESKAPESGMREISFPDDDPDTLTILLNIAHLRFSMVPNSVDFKTLVNLAVLTDKYGAEGLLSPWLGVWMEPYITKYATPGWEELLYVFWAFGYAETFDDLSPKLVMELGLNDEGKPVTPDKRVLDADGGLHFPPSMIETIMAFRKDKINRILEPFYSKLGVYMDPASYYRPQPYLCGRGKDEHEKRCCDDSFLVLYKSPSGKLD